MSSKIQQIQFQPIEDVLKNATVADSTVETGCQVAIDESLTIGSGISVLIKGKLGKELDAFTLFLAL